jgi:hypothetical protein
MVETSNTLVGPPDTNGWTYKNICVTIEHIWLDHQKHMVEPTEASGLTTTRLIWLNRQTHLVGF